MIIHGERPFRQRTKQGLTIAPMKSGRFMLRVKSSLTAKRVKKDPAFKSLIEDAGRMKIASPLASRVYRELEIGDVRVYRQMVGRAKGLLKEGMAEPKIEIILRKEYGPVEMVFISTGIIYPVRDVRVISLYPPSSYAYISSA
ncbi:hypothetical protein [Chitinophaga sancti]|uniref:Uncharacterized protein n=1 Tax=Chitinophaga sancti TaxID=1004 RepID=A0A1K1PIL5_9BACT|nr:hypothetical protein [Chitinophaga sancti]WQD59437.1 hypothetical protein U0033_16215 [Chitinophaga sancti]WQG88429.1 hypothetical protein SR876_26255 [Chitinophaga sancti]SFW47444.1 hypothetical protein SAMN05661012_02014 [Chitinophaga sancti]